MLVRLSLSVVLLIGLASLGSAEETQKEQHESDFPSPVAAGKRSKRDSISPDLYKESAGDTGEGSMLSPAFPPDVQEMLSDPAVMQALYERARGEKDGFESDSDHDNDDDDDGGDDGIFTSPYATNGDMASNENEDEDDSAEKRARLFVGKRPRLFVGKRRLFVGKRRLFVGKRRLFVGKRQRLFVGKRPHFADKRQRLFVGKRNRLFVGKRQRLFVGKRDWQANMQRHLQEFLQQKNNIGADFPERFREFVGKRYGYLSDFQADKRPQRMFVGKRDDYAQMLQRVQNLMAKRARLFVGKRDHFLSNYPEEQEGLGEFANKRQDEVANVADDEGPPGDFNGEPMEKRHRYFVGKRSELMADNGDKDGSVDAVASSTKDLKRSRQFVGRR